MGKNLNRDVHVSLCTVMALLWDDPGDDGEEKGANAVENLFPARK